MTPHMGLAIAPRAPPIANIVVWVPQTSLQARMYAAIEQIAPPAALMHYSGKGGPLSQEYYKRRCDCHPTCVAYAPIKSRVEMRFPIGGGLRPAVCASSAKIEFILACVLPDPLSATHDILIVSHSSPLVALTALTMRADGVPFTILSRSIAPNSQQHHGNITFAIVDRADGGDKLVMSHSRPSIIIALDGGPQPPEEYIKWLSDRLTFSATEVSAVMRVLTSGSTTQEYIDFRAQSPETPPAPTHCSCFQGMMLLSSPASPDDVRHMSWFKQ